MRKNRSVLIALLTALLFTCGEAYASRLRLNGQVADLSGLKPLAGARVRIYKDGKLWREQGANMLGRYMVLFDNNHDYVVRVDAPGFQGKCFTLETHGPEWQGDRSVSHLDVEIRLPVKEKGIDLSWFDLPLGIAHFEPSTGFTRWNRTYEQNISAATREVMDRYAGYTGPMTLTGAAARMQAKQAHYRL